jgi:hypothetical protein
VGGSLTLSDVQDHKSTVPTLSPVTLTSGIGLYGDRL